MKRRYALDHAQNMLSNCFFEESKVYIERILKTGEIRSSPKYLGNILECIDNTIPFTKGT